MGYMISPTAESKINTTVTVATISTASTKRIKQLMNQILRKSSRHRVRYLQNMHVISILITLILLQGIRIYKYDLVTFHWSTCTCRQKTLQINRIDSGHGNPPFIIIFNRNFEDDSFFIVIIFWYEKYLYLFIM